MNDVFFSIDASIVLNGENIRGTLSIDEQRIKFVSNESVLLDKVIIWDKLEYTVKKEKVRKFLLFSTTNYMISFTENGISLPCLVIDEKHGETVSGTIDRIREKYVKQKGYQKKLEEERRREAERLEAERQRKFEEERRREAERLEAERQRKFEEERRKEAERLEAEKQRKLEEEHRKEAERLEAEKQRKLEEERRREAERLEAEKQRKLEEEHRKEVERLANVRATVIHTISAGLKKTERNLVVILNQIAKKRIKEEYLKEKEHKRKCKEERQKEADRLAAERRRERDEERLRKIEEERRKVELQEKFDNALFQEIERLEAEFQRKLVEERQRKAARLEAELRRKLEEERRKEAERLEAERQRKLEEERRKEAERLEAERQRKLEEERLEAERLEAERQRKLEEERRKEAERLEAERQRKLEEERRKEAERLETERQRKLEEERRKETERLEAERQRKLEEERLEAERIEQERQRKIEEDRHHIHHQIVVNQAKQKQGVFDIDEYYDYDFFLHYKDACIDSNPWVESFSKFIEQYCEYCYDGRGVLIARKAQILFLAFSALKNRIIGKDILEYEYEDFVSEYYSVRANSEVEYLVENIVMNALYSNVYNEGLLAKTLEIILTDFHDSLVHKSIYDEAENDISKQYYSTYSYEWDVNESKNTISSLYSELYNYSLEEDFVKDINSVASEKATAIIEFVRKQKKPVSIGQLKKSFPSIKRRTVFKMFETNEEIINYRKMYFSSRQLNLSDVEKEVIKEEIDNYLGSNFVSHIEGIYDFLRPDFSRVLSKMFVNNSYELFSVLSVLYKEDFEFKRPFIALKGNSIPTIQEWLQAYISNFEELQLEKLLSYAKGKYLKIPSITDFIVSISDTTVLKNKYTFMQRQLVVENESTIQTVDSLIYNELLSTVPVKAIRDLSCIVNMPHISVPWNEWLIFTVLLVGERKTHLFTTSNKYKNAIPVVSLNSKVNTRDLELIADRYAGYEEQDTDVLIDDLDDLDTLIEDDISLDDIEDIDFDFDDFDGDDE